MVNEPEIGNWTCGEYWEESDIMEYRSEKKKGVGGCWINIQRNQSKTRGERSNSDRFGEDH